MEKQPFNQAGVDARQANFMNLSDPEKAVVISQIRTDFDAWMNDWFALTPSQQLSVQTMDATFKQQLATAIANNYQAGNLVNFSKEEKDGDEIPDRKETEVFGLEAWQTSSSVISALTQPVPLMIRISYRSLNS